MAEWGREKVAHWRKTILYIKIVGGMFDAERMNYQSEIRNVDDPL